MVVDDIELARAAIVGALMAVERLMSNEVYDVEYAEGDGGFVQKFLLDAQKAVVGAQSIAKGIGQAGDALAGVHV